MKVIRRIESAWIQSRTYADLSGIAREMKRDKEAARLYESAKATAERIGDHVMGGEPDHAVPRPRQRGHDREPAVRDRRPPVGGLRQYFDEGMAIGRDDRVCLSRRPSCD